MSSLDQLANTGILGAVLVWFMLRLEGILKENTMAMASLEKAITRLCEKNGEKP